MGLELNGNFNKEKSIIVKGFAILCMITYHVWGVNKYQPILGNSFNIEKFIGQFGHICVPIYLFLSGYAMYLVACRSNFKYIDLIKRVIKLLLKYWLIFIIFIPFGFFIFGVYKCNITELFLNFTTIKISYNGDWWFLRLYIQLMIIFPIFKYIVSKYTVRKTLIISGLIYLLGFFMFLALKINLSNITKTLIYQDIQVVFVDQLIFTIGCIFAKYNLFMQIQEKIKKYKLDYFKIYILVLLIMFIVRSIMYVFFEEIIRFGSPDWFDFAMVPIVIFCVYNIFSSIRLKKIMIILGKNSDNMWLTHTFFYKLYFQNIIYSIKSSVLILIIVILLSFISSTVINFIYKKISELYERVNNYIKIKTFIWELNKGE